jgi:hypothetical protein
MRPNNIADVTNTLGTGKVTHVTALRQCLNLFLCQASTVSQARSLYDDYQLHYNAFTIARSLLKMESYETLEMVLVVWVELLLYAGGRCSRDSHARHLSNGGELVVTVLWLMMAHQNSYPALYVGSRTLCFS